MLVVAKRDSDLFVIIFDKFEVLDFHRGSIAQVYGAF
jgi:hypothetical protein